MSLPRRASGVLLVGGKSRRMGRDKLVLEVDGKPLVQRVADALAARCEEVILVGGAGPDLPDGTLRVPDHRPGAEGPLAGIEAGLEAASNPLAFVAAGDMPFLSPGLVGNLLDRLAAQEVLAVVPRSGGRDHPLCAAYSRDVLPLARSALDGGVRAVREFLGSLDGVEYVDAAELRRFGDPDLLLMNVNSPDDLERARRVERR